MSSLKLLASTGRAVVACLHQPRSGITALFDALLLLSEGRVMFSGTSVCSVLLSVCGALKR
jgi:ABC-type multidrug transport system ATPase subunit